MTDELKKEIKETYQSGAFSPLQLSYKFNVEISEVLEAIGEGQMNEVILVGDQIDDAGPGATINYGTRQRVQYTKN